MPKTPLPSPLSVLVLRRDSTTVLAERCTPGLAAKVASVYGKPEADPIHACPDAFPCNGVLDLCGLHGDANDAQACWDAGAGPVHCVTIPAYDLHRAGLLHLPKADDAGAYYDNCALLARWIRERLELPCTDAQRKTFTRALESALNTGD